MEKISMLIFNDELDFMQNYLTQHKITHQIKRHEKTGNPVIQFDNTPLNAMHLFFAGQEYVESKIFPKNSSHGLSR